MSNNSHKRDWIVKLLTQASKSKKDLQNFLTDILSPAEIDDIYDRLKIISELAQKKTHREVSKNLNVSISKVTRAANVIKYGSGIFIKMFGSKKNP